MKAVDELLNKSMCDLHFGERHGSQIPVYVFATLMTYINKNSAYNIFKQVCEHFYTH